MVLHNTLMIRIRSIRYKISFSLFFLGISIAANAQFSIGARGVSLGQANTALPDNDWSLYSNTALLNSEQASFGFYGLRNYGFVEITDMAAFVSMPTSFGTGGIGIHRYGDNIYNETRVRFGYKNEWQQLHVGLALNYNHISFGGPYGSGGAFGVDIGIAAQVADQLWLGATATNLNQPAYSFSSGKEDLTRELSIGFSYALEETALFVMDVVKDVRFPVSYRGGLEATIVEELKGRIGVTLNPRTYSFGLGYGKDFWEVNLAMQQHNPLGLSPGFDLLFHF